MTKDEIRKEVLKRRLALSDREVSSKSRAICSRLVSEDVFVTASVVGLYWPFRNEVLTQSIFHEALSRHKKVGFPLVCAQQHRITYVAVNDPSELAAGTLGIMEPRFIEDRVIPAEELDLIVVPGVAFDERGYRIGYGGGYFDRLLTARTVTATRAAPAFDMQIVDRVPHEDHDEKVDIILTESRTIGCT